MKNALICLLLVIGSLAAQAQTDPEGHPWWQHAVFYEIYPRSFADSNNDGVGDLNGIRSKLDYLKQLGVDAIWISPCYPSPQVDFGYDISDYENIDPMYGTMKDFDTLSAEAKKHGIRIIMDFVPTTLRTSTPGSSIPVLRKTQPIAIGTSGATEKTTAHPTTGMLCLAAQPGSWTPKPTSTTTTSFTQNSRT